MLNFFSLFFHVVQHFIFVKKCCFYVVQHFFFGHNIWIFKQHRRPHHRYCHFHNWCKIISIKPIYDIMNYVWKFLWNSPRNLIRILLASLIIQQIIWLLSSSRIKWPWIFCEILAEFDHNLTRNLNQNFHQKNRWPWNYCEFFKDSITIPQEIFINISIRKIDDHWIILNFSRISSEFLSRIRWPQNSCEILEGFWSEFWRPVLLPNISDDYSVLQELNDSGSLVKFFQYLMRSLQ